jgi:ribosomal protein S18 acetylase RimI-like enzyme
MMSHTAITVRPLTQADRLAVGRLYARAFSSLMDSMLRRHAGLGAELMTDFIEPSPNVWVAELDGSVAGIAWVQDRSLAAPEEHTWKTLRRHLPLRVAVRAWVHFSMLHGISIGADRLYLDSLAVDPDYEGRGVGGTLLRHVIDEAARRQKAAVCLYVLDRDQEPRDMYRRRGFTTVRSEAPRLFKNIVGFDSSDFMELMLDESRLADEAEPRTAGGKVGDLLESWLWRRLPPVER